MIVLFCLPSYWDRLLNLSSGLLHHIRIPRRTPSDGHQLQLLGSVILEGMVFWPSGQGNAVPMYKPVLQLQRESILSTLLLTTAMQAVCFFSDYIVFCLLWKPLVLGGRVMEKRDCIALVVEHIHMKTVGFGRPNNEKAWLYCFFIWKLMKTICCGRSNSRKAWLYCICDWTHMKTIGFGRSNSE